MNPGVRLAGGQDTPAIAALLTACGLETPSPAQTARRFWLHADEHGELTACLGCEAGHRAALLRSLAVRVDCRGRGLARGLIETALAALSSEGVERALCFSTDAGTFWQSVGFVEVPVGDVVAALPDAPQVRDYAARGMLPEEVAYCRGLATTALDEARGQRLVRDFIARHALTAPPGARLLDLISEVGELAKTSLKATAYGRTSFVPDDAWRDEIGDVYFSLLALASASGVDLDHVLGATLLKYRSRHARSGEIGSTQIRGDDHD